MGTPNKFRRLQLDDPAVYEQAVEMVNEEASSGAVQRFLARHGVEVTAQAVLSWRNRL